MEVRTFPADAIIICTGGIGAIFGKSTNSVVCTGSAQSALYQQGCYYANGEFIQVHPTSIPGEDKLRLMSESARGEGGRVWVPKAPGDKRIMPTAMSSTFPFTANSLNSLNIFSSLLRKLTVLYKYTIIFHAVMINISLPP